MSCSEQYSDGTSSSVDSKLDYTEDYELEVEQFDVGSNSASNDASEISSKDNTVAAAAAILPCSDEPIADKEWVEKYVREKKRDKLHVEALQQRLDDTVAVNQWQVCFDTVIVIHISNITL